MVQPIAESNGLDAIQIAGSVPFPNNKQGVFDYFIRDFQSNVRIILTDENHFSSGTATMEQERASREEPYFGQPTGANELAQTRFPVNQIPGQLSGGGWQNSGIGNYVSKLGNLAAGKIGPNSLLKVMAGDEISASTQYYYKTDITNTGSSNIAENVISSLLAALTGGGSNFLQQKAGNIGSQLSQNGTFGNFVQPLEGTIGSAPKAYLSVLFFDERFNFIPEGSGQLRATDADNSNANLSLLNLKAPKNGYAYIYVSNSSDVSVYFDNLKVAHNRGRIVEENHYYAFGLRIAAISSKKLADQTGNEGNTTNSYLYNDKELFEEGDLGWFDYGFRQYDAQIGRFPQLDPLTDDYHLLTPYQYASNDPISNIDLDGLEGVSSTGLPDVVVKSTIKHATTNAAGGFVKNAMSGVMNGLKSGGISLLQYSVNVIVFSTEKLIEFKTDVVQRYRQISLNNDIITENTGKSLLVRTLDRIFNFENFGLGGGGLGLIDDVFNLELRFSTVQAGNLKTGISLTANGQGTADLYRVLESGIVYSNSTFNENTTNTRTQKKFEKATTSENYKEVKGNKAANKVSKEYGYKDAHELKDIYVEGNGNKFNIYRDSKSGKIQLRDIKTQKIKIDVSPKN